MVKTEMEKRDKIAQTQVLDLRNSTKNAQFATCHNSRQNSVNCPENKKCCFRTLPFALCCTYVMFYKDCAISTVHCAISTVP